MVSFVQSTRSLTLGAATLLPFLLHCGVRGKDHFLTIGGGYSTTGNQISLEKNVQFLCDVLADHRPDHPPHDIYFADGDLADRDLQYRDPNFECPRARRITNELFGDGEVALRYRNHKLSDVRGPSAPNRIRSRLRQLGGELQPGDRLFLYATAHGGASYEENNSHDTRLYMWDSESVTASDFTTWLDQLPKGVQVVMVMVQCYSGGFAHTIFNQADDQMGLSEQVRCGFFSQRHDRVSAGCTPDVNEANYQEYSSFFWAALAGRDRTGMSIPRVDYDGDGETSLAEAHGYAVIESETVDIPLRASDAFLRKYSKLGKAPAAAPGADGEPLPRAIFDLFAGDREEGDAAKPVQPDGPELLAASGTLTEMAEHADAIDRAIIQQLAAKLEIEMDTTVAEVNTLVKQAAKTIEASQAKYGVAYTAYDKARDNTLSEVRRRWPELEGEYPPLLAAFMAERADEFVDEIESMLSYQAMRKGHERAEKLSAAALDAQKHEARLRRLQFALRRVARAANLPRIANEEKLARYEQLMSLESSKLSPPPEEEPTQEIAQVEPAPVADVNSEQE